MNVAVTPSVACSICHNETSLKFDDLYDDRYGYSGLYQLRECATCGHLRLNATFQPRQLTRLYTQFYPRAELSLEQFRGHEEVGGWKAWWNGERSAAFRWVPPNVRVLDIGCGFGQTLAYHRARGCDVYGCEADENIRRVAERFGFNVHVGIFDPEVYPPDYFDYVTLDQVVEHSTDPVGLLQGVARVLKRGGMAVLSTPNPEGALAKLFGRQWMNWHTPYHLQFFTRRSMKAAATSAGMQVVRVKTTTHSQWIVYQLWHVLSRPQRMTPSAFWTSRGEQRYLSRRLGRLVSLLEKTRVNNVATRVLDGLGFGDNRLYVLQKPL